ncbi:M56 family metallopeptidase [Parahaliea aestuarii]|uniref:M56 family metallopeptidase n=1 Tax=Parahaliea aestuarii TaxID=1852021 RepID=A0A5C9A297_9GAMM|nr:M56 family metallopeptidase [Parahaliea aestuarii]TXS95003.1 M56 family metallopeptidase [Parahaliea aestuarii]
MSGWIELLAFSTPSPGGLALLFAKALLILTIGALLASDLGMSSAAVRHRAPFATLLCLVGLPVLSAWAPQWSLPLLPASATGPASLLADTVLLIYLGGAAARASHLAWEMAKLLRVTVTAGPADAAWYALLAGRHSPLPARLRILTSDRVDSPMTWGWLHPVILVPAYSHLTKVERAMVLDHELAHIRRGDWLTHLLGQIAGVLYWPIPGLRQALAQLALESEQACDNHVLAARHSPPDYAALLLAQARHPRQLAAVSLSRQPDLALRIRNICSPGLDHSDSTTGWPWLIPLSLALILPLAGLNPTSINGSVTFSPAQQQVTLQLLAGPTPTALPFARLPERIPPAAKMPALTLEVNRADYRLAKQLPATLHNALPSGAVEPLIQLDLQRSPVSDRPP